MKYYLIYFKKDKSLYAITGEKSYVDAFLYQRDSNKFVVKSKKFHSDEPERTYERLFLNTYSNLLLVKDILTDGEKDYEIVATTQEASEFDNAFDMIQHDIFKIRQFTKNNKTLQDKYIDAMSKLVDQIELLYDKNTFNLFYKLFIDTF